MQAKFKPVFIVWDDAESSDGWETPPDKLEERLCYTLGYLVLESPTHVLVAATVDKEHETTNNRLQIPKAMIKEMKTDGLEVDLAIPTGTNKRRKNASKYRRTGADRSRIGRRK